MFEEKVSPEVRRATVARVEAGEKPDDLAIELGVHRSRVYRWWKRERDGPPMRAAAMRAAAAAHATDALAALAAVMANSDASDASRIAAANAILDRALGKAGQPPAAKLRKLAIKRIERIIVDQRQSPG